MVKLGINSNLSRSVFVVTTFWILLGIVFYIFVPVNKIDSYFQLIGYTPEIEVKVINQIELITYSLKYRILQASPYILGGFLFGLLVLGCYFVFSYISRRRRSMSDSYLGMTCKIAPIPRSRVYAFSKVKSVVKCKLSSNQPLMDELLAYAKAHKDHFIGHAHGDTGLYKHTLSVIKKAQQFENAHYLLELAAAAHDLGKVITFEGQQANNKYHDIEGGKILRKMSKINTLSHQDQMMLILAVTYQHHKEQLPLSIPSFNEEQCDSSRLLLSQLISIDGSATSEEKEEIIQGKSVDIDECLYAAFVELIKTASFYSSSSSRKSSNIGYRWGDRVFLFEYMAREFLMNNVPLEISRQLDLDVSSAKRVSNGMKRFLYLMNEKGMLVTQSETANGDIYTLPVDLPFWDVKSGDYDFKAMIVLEIKNEISAHLPPESVYPVQIKCPYRMASASKVKSGANSKGEEKVVLDKNINEQIEAFSSSRKSRNIKIEDLRNTDLNKDIDVKKEAEEIISIINEIEIVPDSKPQEQGDTKDIKKSTHKPDHKKNNIKAKSSDIKNKPGNGLPPNLF